MPDSGHGRYKESLLRAVVIFSFPDAGEWHVSCWLLSPRPAYSTPAILPPSVVLGVQGSHDFNMALKENFVVLPDTFWAVYLSKGMFARWCLLSFCCLPLSTHVHRALGEGHSEKRDIR